MASDPPSPSRETPGGPPSLEERVSALEAAPRVKTVDERLAALEAKPAPRRRDSFDWLGLLLGPLVGPVLLFALAILFKDSVDQALRARQLELESGEAIDKLLTTLYGPVDTQGASVAALTLASYGRASILPLVGVLEHGSPEAEMRAAEALLSVGLSHREEVCTTLGELIGKRRGQFRWSTHRTAIRVLGQLECQDARKALEDYAAVVQAAPPAGAEPWLAMVKDGSQERYDLIRAALVEALDALGVRWIPDRTEDRP
jgi:hypothetical protein